jgi:soluble lytic murein transglycosylase-like protein
MNLKIIIGVLILMSIVGKKVYDFSISGVNDEFDEIFVSSAQKVGVNPRYIKALSLNESYIGKYSNSVTVNGRTTKGLMHLELPTARDYLPQVTESDLAKPEIEIEIATKHFKWLLDQFNGNLELAVRGYNGGVGRVRQYLSNSAPPHWVKNTNEYWERYQRNLNKISNQEA